jgi:hypothetical protein
MVKSFVKIQKIKLSLHNCCIMRGVNGMKTNQAPSVPLLLTENETGTRKKTSNEMSV